MDRRNIIQWYEDVRTRNSAHRVCVIRTAWLYNSISLVAIFSAIIAGIDIATGSASPIKTLIPNYTYLVGLCAIVAAMANGALKFFGFEKKKDQHQTAASRFSLLRYQLEPWINETEEKIPKELYNTIPRQLAEIIKGAPPISDCLLKKAQKKVKKKLSVVISDRFLFNTELTEKWKIENTKVVEIGDNPVRSYICEAFELIEYKELGKIIINGQSTMIRRGKEFPCSFHGEGIINNNIGFLQYSFRDNSSGNITYGTMVLPLKSRVDIEGCWMSAQLVGAEGILIGILRMELQSKGTTN